MIKKALLSTLFIGYIICPAQAQNTDTVSQKRETFVLEEGRPDRSKSRSNQSKLVVAVNNFSQNRTRIVTANCCGTTATGPGSASITAA